MKARWTALGLLVAGLAACGGDDTGSVEDPFTSNQATLMIFEFDGELVTTETYNVESTIQDQLLYTIGHLNENNSVGRLDTVKLSNIQTERLEDGTTRVTYHAILPVGWGSQTNLPSSYDFALPKRIDFQGLQSFTEKYSHSCVDWAAHDVDADSMWYYYRPERSGCSLAAEDVVKFTASAVVSEENTQDKYPEYHMLWEDNVLRVVAIFGKYEDGATTASDAGIAGYNNFVAAIRREWSNAVVTPADAPTNPGVAAPDVEVSAELGSGRSIVVNALLVDNISSAPESFYTRYEALSTEADLLFYNGHSGLGQNVRALARRGDFRPGKHQIFYMNGCDSFAYVDGYLAKTRSTINPDDPTGTKYMDMVTNIMPSFFSSMPNASMALIRRLANPDDPRTYQEIFKEIDRSQVVVVTGEEDNVYTPGGLQEPWSFADGGTVAAGESDSFDLGTLPPGDYLIQLLEDQATPGGDADLYVGIGKVPTLDEYDYRPWLDGSNEEVRFTLTAPTQVHVMVHGYEDAVDPTAAYKVSGKVVEE